jgi:hypothetical protein
MENFVQVGDDLLRCVSAGCRQTVGSSRTACEGMRRWWGALSVWKSKVLRSRTIRIDKSCLINVH